MSDRYISVYLRANRIHVCMNVLRDIGSPGRICFMVDEKCDSLLVAPYHKRDLKSHRVPEKVYKNCDTCLEISSQKLCRIFAENQRWEIDKYYRIPGVIDKKNKVAVFRLTQANVIEH